MIHIIQVIADSGLGGGPKHVRQLILGLKKNKDFVISLVCPPGQLADGLKNEVEVKTLEIPNAWNKKDQRSLKSEINLLNDKYPDAQPIVHLHGVRAGILGRLSLQELIKKTAVQIVYTEHLWTKDYHLPSRWREALQLWYLKRLDRFSARTIAVSQAVADFLIKKGITSANKIVVVPNGVEFPEKKSANRILGKGEFRIGSVGTLTPIKGFDILIAAMPLILQNHPDTTLEIVGDGPDMARLKKLVRKLKLSGRVKLLGEKPGLNEIIETWDLFVSASASESFGLAVAEAMAVGLPVVATNVGGVPELVTAEAGRLVPPNDPSTLAKAVVDLLGQPQKLVQMGQAGRERIRTHFTVEKMVNRTEEVYREIVK